MWPVSGSLMKEPLALGRAEFGDSGISPLSALLARHVALGRSPSYNKMMQSFSLGVLITSSLGTDGIDPGSISTLASRISSAGVGALFVATSRINAVEPVTVLAGIAAVNDLVLGAVVSLESGRNPAIVAKSATTLALMAPARVALLFESDQAADSLRLLEAVEVAASLTLDGPVSAGGGEFFVRDAYNEPRPSEREALAVGVIVDRISPELAMACDLVLTRVDKVDPGVNSGANVVPVVGENTAIPISIESVVVQVDGASIDHVVEVVARMRSRRS